MLHRPVETTDKSGHSLATQVRIYAFNTPPSLIPIPVLTGGIPPTPHKTANDGQFRTPAVGLTPRPIFFLLVSLRSAPSDTAQAHAANAPGRIRLVVALRSNDGLVAEQNMLQLLSREAATNYQFPATTADHSAGFAF